MHRRIIPLIILNVVLVTLIVFVGVRMAQEWSGVREAGSVAAETSSSSGRVSIDVVAPDIEVSVDGVGSVVSDSTNSTGDS